MPTNHNQTDASIEKTFAALRHAAPPAGMEARILEHLSQPAERLSQPAAPDRLRWSDLCTGSALAAVWWRGAVSGAAAAALVACAVLFTGHLAQIHSTAALRQAAALRPIAPVPVAATSQRASATQSLANPCAAPGVVRVRGTAPAHSTESLRAEALAEAYAPSHPAPVMPLTAQERALAELARTASPRVLASLSLEAQAQQQAEQEAAFQKFFTPPPPPPQPGDDKAQPATPQSPDTQPATKTNNNQSQI